VLWLDRLNRFSPAAVTVPMLRQSRKESPGLRVVATINSTRYAAFLGEEPELAAALGDPVRLSRLLSPAERTRAAEVYPEPGRRWGQCRPPAAACECSRVVRGLERRHQFQSLLPRTSPAFVPLEGRVHPRLLEDRLPEAVVHLANEPDKRYRDGEGEGGLGVFVVGLGQPPPPLLPAFAKRLVPRHDHGVVAQLGDP
jgi:hypothetical protein